jgi:hypothetical protein
MLSISTRSYARYGEVPKERPIARVAHPRVPTDRESTLLGFESMAMLQNVFFTIASVDGAQSSVLGREEEGNVVRGWTQSAGTNWRDRQGQRRGTSEAVEGSIVH